MWRCRQSYGRSCVDMGNVDVDNEGMGDVGSGEMGDVGNVEINCAMQIWPMWAMQI